MTPKLLTGQSSAWLGAGCAVAALALAAPSFAAESAPAPVAPSATPTPPASTTPPVAEESAPPPSPAQPAAASEPVAASPAASPVATAPEPEHKIQIPVAEPPAPVARTLRIHDGFYLRLNAGVGFVGARFDDGRDATGDVLLDGSDMALDLLVGGSPSPGVTLGGGVFMNLLLAADAEQDDNDLTSRDVGILLVGPFIDGFPNPKKGWHLGGTLGLAVANMDDMGPRGDVSRTAGFGAAAWGGYDAWIGDDWSVGGLLRLGITRTSDRDDDAKTAATSRSLTLMFTALYQ